MLMIVLDYQTYTMYQPCQGKPEHWSCQTRQPSGNNVGPSAIQINFYYLLFSTHITFDPRVGVLTPDIFINPSWSRRLLPHMSIFLKMRCISAEKKSTDSMKWEEAMISVFFSSYLHKIDQHRSTALSLLECKFITMCGKTSFNN